jgi:hypothetical protein
MLCWGVEDFSHEVGVLPVSESWLSICTGNGIIRSLLVQSPN